mmetsp:Transcript_7764/g.13849  ORF Transcript_7764/g.13849 Transcript_7764/m.13849 type:complete len:544 (+) Transcript_7764:653-2284(+)
MQGRLDQTIHEDMTLSGSGLNTSSYSHLNHGPGVSNAHMNTGNLNNNNMSGGGDGIGNNNNNNPHANNPGNDFGRNTKSLSGIPGLSGFNLNMHLNSLNKNNNGNNNNNNNNGNHNTNINNAGGNQNMPNNSFVNNNNSDIMSSSLETPSSLNFSSGQNNNSNDNNKTLLKSYNSSSLQLHNPHAMQSHNSEGSLQHFNSGTLQHFGSNMSGLYSKMPLLSSFNIRKNDDYLMSPWSSLGSRGAPANQPQGGGPQQQQQQQQQLQNHHHHQEQQQQYQQYQQQQSTAMYARREDLTRSPSRKTRKPDGVKDSMMEGTREPMVNLGATGGGKSCNTPSDRREKLRSERRKLKASLRLADLHVQELNLQAPRCVVCQCPFANYEECQTAQNCMRGKRNFLTIKLRKLERSIASYEKKASITPSTVRYMPFLRSKRKVSSTEASTSPDSTSSMNSSPPSPSSLDLSADQSVQQQQQQEHTHSGRGKSDKTTHGPTIRLGYVNYFRSLRSEGLNTKKCPMCTKPLNDMATFLSTLDRFSFLAYQRFF